MGVVLFVWVTAVVRYRFSAAIACSAVAFLLGLAYLQVMKFVSVRWVDGSLAVVRAWDGPWRVPLDDVVAWTSVAGVEVLHVRRAGSVVEIPVRIVDPPMRDYDWNVRFESVA